MAENKTVIETNEPSVEKKPGFITRFRTQRPRTFKAVLITAGLLGAAGIGVVVGAKKSDDDSTWDSDLEQSDNATNETSVSEA